MKYLYLYIILCFVLPIKMIAQDGDEWPDENIYVGCSYVRSSLGTKKGMLYYSIKTIEEVDGIKYFKMYTSFDELSEMKERTHEMSFLDETTCSDVLSLWQDGGKVYCQNEDGTQTCLIFDYGLEAGDSFTDGAGENYIVKESTMTDAPKRKKLMLVSKDGSKEDTWIDGIGSVQYGFLPAYVVRTLKDFQHVEEPLSVNLWMASEPANGADGIVSICQGINDEYLKMMPFQEITDEDMTYEDLPNPMLTCSFVGDSLWVQGYYPLNLYQSFIAASIAGNQIDISFHQVVTLDVVKGYRPAKIDVRIPGFKPGVYQVGMPGQERVERECKRSTKYFPEGTKWTEIRLDTMKYDTWYSKVDGEWMPNFETVEYRVQGEYGKASDNYWNAPYKCVYTNSSEWTDSLTLLISEGELNGFPTSVLVTVFDNDIERPLEPSSYPFEWEVGTMIRFKDILSANATAIFPKDLFDFGIVEEVNEGDFGGVRPLKYSDVKGVRMVQGIGVTAWNDGECIFGPLEPYKALSLPHKEERHYRSMLVHFERDGEVLYDVWSEKKAAEDPVTFTTGQMATIIMPTAPDASKGKYYRLDRVEDNQIVFEQERQPQARVPYIIVPDEDFSIDPETLELAGLSADTVKADGIRFIGTYCREVLSSPGGEGEGSFYYDIIDQTPDCSPLPGEGLGEGLAVVGALRAYLQVPWDEPYSSGSPRSPQQKMEIVLKDKGTGSLSEIKNEELKIKNDGGVYDLQGRKIDNGQAALDGRRESQRTTDNGQWSNGQWPRIYIQDGRKVIIK